MKRKIKIATLCLLSSLIFKVAATEEVPQIDWQGIWHDSFAQISQADDEAPAGWKTDAGKMFVPMPEFKVVSAEGASNGTALQLVSDKATGAVIAKPEIDLNKTPILRWRWRVKSFPPGGDGRQSATDDQAIVIYCGAGSALSRKSVSYRWETQTPIGFEGTNRYGGGLVGVFYRVLRNQSSGTDVWQVEEVNVAEDFKKQYGYIPEEFVISIGCNSQYTKSKTVAEIDYIGFAKE